MVALLHPDVTFTGDANRVAPTAARVIHGPDKVARFLFGLAQRYGPVVRDRRASWRLINGELGTYTPGSLGRRRVSGDHAADHGDDGARRKGLRPMGYREPGEVHRFAAGESLALVIHRHPAGSHRS